jgi:DNA repair protein RecN (Recombination protein N)
MLQRLHIRNYAIIEELEIDFAPGLNIITGETGAGKSILMGALGLVLGNRADTSVLLKEGEKCVVEATFDAKNHPALAQQLQQLELDGEEELLLRREIAPGGKSRSFVNDTPVNLPDLKQIAGLMVDLHRQFDTLALADANFQYEIIDALAGNNALLRQYRQVFADSRKALNNLKRLQEQAATASRELDYITFLLQELQEAAFKPDEIEQLEQEMSLLQHAEGIKSALEQVGFLLLESDTTIPQQLKQLAQGIAQAGGTQQAEANELRERLLAAQVELQDIGREAMRIYNRISLDPERLNKIEQRLSLAYKLQKKHAVDSTAGLLAVQKELQQKLDGITSLDNDLTLLEKELVALEKEAINIAAKLTAARQKVVAPLEKTTNAYLAQMGMPNARLRAVCNPLPADKPDAELLHHFGNDEVALLFDGNGTGRFEPIGKVASGGELSRLMLAIKAQVASKIHLPALIFDEIDTGISGEAARQVGLLMRQLAEGHQVIAITHQPQIAARANAHFFVYKQAENGKVKTKMRRLSRAEQVNAIAMMLGGETPSATVKATALEMINGSI